MRRLGSVLAVTLWAGSAVAGTPAAGLPFVEDDYKSALAQARTHQLPIFVEAWAPW